MHPEFELVKQCLREIETRLQWGESAVWHNDMYHELSERILAETQVLLSPTTLKRVWGRVAYSSAPSITTKNALARFAGYQNWRDFKSLHRRRKPAPLRKKISENIGVITMAASLMTVVFISFFSLRGTGSVRYEPSRIGFTSDPIAEGLPNSVVFRIDLGGYSPEDVRIQQSWDETKTIALKPGQTEATGQYYYPGYFRSKLRLDGTIVKEHDLYIRSDGWLGTLDYDPIPKYVPARELVGGTLSFPPEIVREIQNREEPLISAFHYVNEMGGISGDNFVLETSIRNVYRDKWAVCQQVNILILGTKSALIIPFSIPGCVSEIGVMLSERYLGGKEHDLSGLGLDFREFRDVKIQVIAKTVSVYAGDRLLFRDSFSQTIGKVAGVRFRFRGAGEIGHVRLTDSENGALALDEDFGHTAD